MAGLASGGCKTLVDVRGSAEQLARLDYRKRESLRYTVSFVARSWSHRVLELSANQLLSFRLASIICEYQSMLTLPRTMVFLATDHRKAT